MSITLAKTAIVSADAVIGDGTIVQDYAIIEAGCKVGKNCRIGYHAVLRKGTIIGDNSIFGNHSVSEGDNKIGNNVTVHSQCHVTSKSEIEDWVFIGPCFVSANTSRIKHGRDYPLVLEGFKIRFGARIGAGVTILPKVVIGREALIGAGSLVTRDIPEFSVAYGRPAKVVKTVPDDERLHINNQL